MRAYGLWLMANGLWPMAYGLRLKTLQQTDALRASVCVYKIFVNDLLVN